MVLVLPLVSSSSHPTFAQDNSAEEIMKSQENLEKFEQKTSTTTDQPSVVQETLQESGSSIQTVNSSMWSAIGGICMIMDAHDRVAPKEPVGSKNPIEIIRKYGFNETDVQALKNIKSCDDVKQAEKKLWLSWKDPDKMFQVDFPAAWQHKERQNRFDPYDLILPIDDSTAMGINLDYTSLSNLAEVLDGVLEANKDNSGVKLFQREDSSKYVINGHPTAMIIFTVKNPTHQQVQQVVYSLIGDKLLTIQYVAPSNIFDRHLPTVDKVIQSASVSN